MAPPFAGHLFPLIQMAAGLRDRGWSGLRFLSTPQAEQAVSIAKFPFRGLLDEQSKIVFKISDTEQRVGSNPFKLLGQLRMNLSLMDDLRSELQDLWQRDPPDLVIADLTVPIAGLLAESMGIAWWTSTPTPCVVETGDGVPSYLGGWRPARSAWTRPVQLLRDALGRAATSCFKRSMHFAFNKRLSALGVDRIYRSDGYETVYSKQKILALGIEELEFERNWPEWMHFIGPLTASPHLPHAEPVFDEGKPHVLVSAGTHLWWAKQRLEQLIRDVAAQVPEFVFHLTLGRAISAQPQEMQVPPRIEGNFHVYQFLPYDKYAHRYQMAIHHCGTGVMYRCLSHGIPCLGWPQDYDQFDHLARLEYMELGKRLVPRPDRIAADLRQLSCRSEDPQCC